MDAHRPSISEVGLEVEKRPKDRPDRTLKDWGEVDALDIEIHLVKEGVVLARDSKSAEKFMHGIRVLMAKNYIDNLAEESPSGDDSEAR